MKSQLVKLSEKEIAQQLQYVAKYQQLLQKEINHKDLANMENIKSYSKSIQTHMALVINPYIEMPVFN